MNTPEDVVNEANEKLAKFAERMELIASVLAHNLQEALGEVGIVIERAVQQIDLGKIEMLIENREKENKVE